jgi:CPA2 family monovalent cation:H+ antiporter-2
MEQVHALSPAVLLLLVGILSVVGMQALRLSPVVGYLLAGMAIGPHGLALVPEGPTTHLLAELGVVFLLFDIGLHFSLAHIWEARRDILGLGPLQVLLGTVGLGAVALMLGVAPVYALIAGATLAMSSTAVVMQVLAERNQRNCPVGMTATAILIFQDICAIFLLVLAASLGGPQESLLAAFGAAAINAAAAFAAALLIGRYAIGPLFDLLARTRQEELFTATALFIVLVAAIATGALGLSLTLGAFLGGMIISETAYRHVIQMEIKPFRGLLLGFFFITVGMSLDLGLLAREWPLILVFLAGLIVLKTVLIAAAALCFRWSVPGSVQLAFLLAQGSEFAFVIFGLPAVRAGLGETVATIAITGIAASLALTPSLAQLGRTAAGRLRRRLARAQPQAELTPRNIAAPVVVFGMDETGRTVADALEAHAIGYDAIELDYDRFTAANADGYPVSFGDLGDPRLLEAIEMDARKAIVVTIVRYEISAALTPVIRGRYPNLQRFIAVDDEPDRVRFEALGMRAAINRSVPRGLDIAAAVLAAQGVPADKIQPWMTRYQARALEARGERAPEPAAA